MAKKTLNEAVVRRFQRLANLTPINEMYHNRDEDEVMKEEEEEELEMDANAEMDMGAEEVPEEAPEMDAEAEMDGDLELTDDEAQAIIALGSKLEAAMGGMEGMGDMEVDAEVDAEMPDIAAGPEMDAESKLNRALGKK